MEVTVLLKQFINNLWNFIVDFPWCNYNYYSSSPTGLWVNGQESKRKNWFSKIQLVISRLNIFPNLKLDFNPFLWLKHDKYGGRFLLLVGYNI